jgi:trk system potassium uptake protein TrkA
MPLFGKKLKELTDKVSSSILVGVVVRGNDIIIPKGGDFEIKENDTIYAVGKSDNLFNFCRSMGKYQHRIKNVMLVGGGRIAYYLANMITDIGMKVKIIENDRQRCNELSDILPNTLIIHGDGTDIDFLHTENLSDMDAFVALTGRDEENLIAGLLAKHNGVPKVITKINRMNYADIIKGLGLDSIVSPKVITTNLILKYTRGLRNAKGSAIQSLYKIIGGKVEVMEFISNESTSFLNIPLKKLNIDRGILLAAIVRRNDIIIPHGNDVVKLGDSVIIIVKDKKIQDLNDIINAGGLPGELQSSIKKLGDSINM